MTKWFTVFTYYIKIGKKQAAADSAYSFYLSIDQKAGGCLTTVSCFLYPLFDYSFTSDERSFEKSSAPM